MRRPLDDLATPSVEEREAVLAMLRAAALPVEGLDEHWATTLVAREGGAVVGSVTVEPHGAVALLRSLVVDPGRRGEGLGAALVAAARERASAAGADDVYLLTTDAQEWFAGHGFAEAPRDEAPAALTASREWSLGCCRHATLMVAHAT